MSDQVLFKRINDYLSGGGLFNPELANHVAVRDLLIEIRESLILSDKALELARQALESTETDDFSDQFDLEEKALTAIDFALEKL